MIEIAQLTKHYGTKEALAGVSFLARPGEVTGYLGPNGAGKSTTLKLVTGLLRPTSGQVRVCGHDVQAEPLAVRRRLGYVPESAALYTSLTPNEYLSLVAELYHLDRTDAGARIGRLLESFGLKEAADRQIEALSKGMRQKVLIAAALLHDPDVLLLDEPLNGLDAHSVRAFRDLLTALAQRGKTILFCSHLLDVVERLCTRVVVLAAGRVVADAPTAELLRGGARGTLDEVFQDLTRPQGEAADWVHALIYDRPADPSRARSAAE